MSTCAGGNVTIAQRMLPGKLLRSFCSIVLHYKANCCRQHAYVGPALQLIAVHVGEAKLDLPRCMTPLVD